MPDRNPTANFEDFLEWIVRNKDLLLNISVILI
jgi:hypothetical protein